MRIGFLTDFYKPHISGVTNYISINKEHLEQAGHEVYVFTFGDEEYLDDEVNVIRSPGLPMPLAYGGKDLSFGVRYSKAARQYLDSMDIVHVNHPFLSGTLSLRYCRPRGIPIVFTNHTRYDLYVKAYLPQIPEGLGKAFLEAYLPSFCRACDLVIAPSAGLRAVLQNLGVTARIEVVPNGVRLEPFREPAGELDRAKLGFTADNVLFIYVGRLGPEKNLTTLLRSFAGAVEAYEHLGLIIVGDGPESENLHESARLMGLQEKVQFTGRVPYKSIAEYYRLADVFVTASITEVHPLSVIEAMAAGLPVLGIRSVGVGDTVEDGVTGLLSSDDLAAFTAKLIRISTDPELRRVLGERGKISAEKYAIERTTQLLVQHYRELVDQRASRNRGLKSFLGRFLFPSRR